MGGKQVEEYISSAQVAGDMEDVLVRASALLHRGRLGLRGLFGWVGFFCFFLRVRFIFIDVF